MNLSSTSGVSKLYDSIFTAYNLLQDNLYRPWKENGRNRPRQLMECPICDVDLKISERHGIEIDYCPKCRGVWLDRGELDKILDRAAKLESEYERRASSNYHTNSVPHYRDPDHQGSYATKRKNDERYRVDDRHYDTDRRHRDAHYDDEDRRYTRRRKSVLDDIFDIFD